MLRSILEGNHEIWISHWFWIWKNTKNKKIKIIISIHNINSLVSFRYMEIQKDIDTLMASIQLVHCGKDNGFDLMMKYVLGLMKIKLWVCHHICFSIRGRPLILCTLWKQMAMMSRKWLSRFITTQMGSLLFVMIKELILKKNQTIDNQLLLLEKTNQRHIRSSNPERPRQHNIKSPSPGPPRIMIILQMTRGQTSEMIKISSSQQKRTRQTNLKVSIHLTHKLIMYWQEHKEYRIINLKKVKLQTYIITDHRRR